MPPENPKTLSNTTIGLMVGVALFYDALQALFSWFGGGWLIIPPAYGTFWLWFKMKGIKFFTLKRAPSMSVGVGLEFLTAGIIPSITFNVLRTALDYKLKKAIGSIPRGNMAMNMANQKRNAAIKNKNDAAVSNMTRLKPMSGNPEQIREASRKMSAENNMKMDQGRKAFEARNKQWEEQRQSQRKFEKDYGGYQKYDKDLSELKYKYRNSSSSSDKAA